MGLFDRLRRGTSRDVKTPTPPPAAPAVGSFFGNEDLVKLTGTTTFGKAGIGTLIASGVLPPIGMHVGHARLLREPDNPADSNAIAIHLEGHKVGYLPSYLAATLSPDRIDGAVPVQMFTRHDTEVERAEGWAWLGLGEPKWEHSPDNPPPLTPNEKSAADAASREKLVSDALAEGGSRAQEFRAGMVDGTHYLELVEPIKQLKRDGRLDEALELAYRAIEGAEKDRGGREPAPWYTEQAAIIHRKLGQHAEERAVLERWLTHAPASRREGHKIAERHAKLKKQ